MNDLTEWLPISRKIARLWTRLFVGALSLGLWLPGLPAQASESLTPWECSNYSGNAHTRCVEAFEELQRDQIAALEEKLKAQKETVNRLKDQLDRQSEERRVGKECRSRWS